MHRIVIGYDGSSVADAALDKAISLAKTGGEWEVVVVCGEDRPADWTGMTYRGIPIDGDEWLQRWRKQVEEDMEKAVARVREAGVRASSVCTLDEPAELLLKVAHDTGADYIVIGSSGAGGVRDVLMGSTAMRVLHHSDVPVIVVPAQKG